MDAEYRKIRSCVLRDDIARGIKPNHKFENRYSRVNWNKLNKRQRRIYKKIRRYNRTAKGCEYDKLLHYSYDVLGDLYRMNELDLIYCEDSSWWWKAYERQ